MFSLVLYCFVFVLFFLVVQEKRLLSNVIDNGDTNADNDVWGFKTTSYTYTQRENDDNKANQTLR